MKPRAESLRRIPLFHRLPDPVLAEICELLIERKFPKNATIFEEGASGEYMYLIQSGQVKVTKMSEDGREKIVEMFEDGDFFGEMALMERAPRSAAVKTTRPSVLLALSRSAFLSLMRENPELPLEIIRELSHRLRETTSEVRALLFERVEERTRGVLRRLATVDPDAPGRRITPPITHQELAERVGTSRETVTRVLKELRESGWLEQDGKRYRVLEGGPEAAGDVGSAAKGT
ncbi:MAG: Crp/Fnr family transcriptional regulator [Myxococcota bacterium]